MKAKSKDKQQTAKTSNNIFQVLNQTDEELHNMYSENTPDKLVEMIVNNIKTSYTEEETREVLSKMRVTFLVDLMCAIHRKNELGISKISYTYTFTGKTFSPSGTIVPYQCCPKCLGWGTLSEATRCDVCDGKKIIPMYTT